MAGENVISVFGFYVLKQDETGVRLTLGKYSGTVGPGLGFVIPILQKVQKTKSSLQTIDLPEQQIVLSGNISVTISGNLNFRVVGPDRSLLGVANYRYSIQQLSLTTISDVLGTKTIEELRASKTKIANEIETIISRHASDWGLGDVDIRLTDARLDDNLQRAMMRETEAQKEANAIKIKAESDKYVARIFADAARTLAESPGAMTLRILQTLSDVSNDKTTILMPIPIDMLTAFRAGAEPSFDQLDVDSVSSPLGTDESTDHVFPVADLKLQGERTVAICPSCDAKYNVTDILGNMRYDGRPDVPGQQVQCKRCETLFTLPETT